MRDRQQEATLPLLAGGQRAVELAQRLGDLGHLARAARRYVVRDAPLPRRQAARGRCQTGERPTELSRDQGARRERDEQPERQREEQAAALETDGLVDVGGPAGQHDRGAVAQRPGLDQHLLAAELAVGRDLGAAEHDLPSRPRSGRARRPWPCRPA